ncbi:hypothetical protein PF005_g26676 [Phytophthora fragariae]|uniref:C2H2-type domain-containing protein n=1 Tax=Phytophthora fragariae TaxID=53985 RepID=A0A6A3W9K6_9STRA|nr:hypothetical protein PF009_g27244 [Phytophthora fragariae]KAE9069861.1 hypothetical protein PF010_g26506 [Phytophthora fragariae]KAE9071584.1 hypothetical protein PF007_g26496 [Phytophthora fragariae]KAE9087131.1 hypothetical protein PF006_g25875 [Phytophthora fragariae]KAE9172524.1 hypothetical protein PF005_g26676 [Phytophthora fragariae]
MHKKRKPEHWRFIQLVCKNEYIGMNIKDLRSEHARSAYCNKCGEEIVFEKSNTAHVTRHMKKKHPKELKKGAEDEKARKQNSFQSLMHQDVGTLRKPVAVLPPATE